MLSAVAYTGTTLYSTYQAAQTELERAANISVDSSLANKNVRDLLLDIPETDSLQALDDNLVQAGYVQESESNWVQTINGKIYYSLEDLQVSVAGEVLDITATVSMPLPWIVGNTTSVDLPIHVESRVLYIN
jgi:archaellum component FlaF (FlaF/FlaG flagellin family)